MKSKLLTFTSVFISKSMPGSVGLYAPGNATTVKPQVSTCLSGIFRQSGLEKVCSENTYLAVRVSHFLHLEHLAVHKRCRIEHHLINKLDEWHYVLLGTDIRHLEVTGKEAQ
jgi:hypothetical protein